MSAGVRLFFGALLGALIALLAVGTSRQVILDPWIRPHPSSVIQNSPWSARSADQGPPPRSVEAAAFSLLLACEELSERRTLRPTDRALLRDVARAQADREPENAFWRQMQALLEPDLVAARKAWFRAARSNAWNDFQSQRLATMGSELAAQSGGERSWHYAVLARERSASHVQRLIGLSDDLMAQCKNSEEALALQVATIENANLIRRGSRSLLVGERALRMLETAVSGTDSQVLVAPRRREVARLQLELALGAEARGRVAKIFRESDSWSAFMRSPEVTDRREQLWRSSLLWNVIPAGTFAACLIGLLIAGFGTLMLRVPAMQAIFRTPWVLVLAVLASGVMFLLSNLPAAAIAAALTLSLFVFIKPQRRSAVQTGLEAGARFQMALLALPLLAALSFLVAGILPVTQAMDFAFVDPFVQLVGTPSMLWLALMLSLVALGTAPLWAWIWKREPSRVAALVLQELGVAMAGLSIVALLVMTPLSILAERETSDALSKILMNEPNYILSQ